MKKLNPLESTIQSSICDYLAIKRYFFYRVNNIPPYDSVNKHFRKMPKNSRKGVADIFLLHKGIPYFIEVKSKTGVISPDQVLFARDVKENGGIYIIARDIEDIRRIGL
jgi:hypothetical protein